MGKNIPLHIFSDLSPFFKQGGLKKKKKKSPYSQKWDSRMTSLCVFTESLFVIFKHIAHLVLEFPLLSFSRKMKAVGGIKRDQWHEMG